MSVPAKESDRMKSPSRTPRGRVLVDLALQGGGAHGAFTWGVLDRLLEEEWLEIEGISGTSAGAMNAAVLASGYAKGGAPAAREALKAFWRRVSAAATFSPFQRGPIDRMLGRWTLDNSPIFLTVDLLARMISPYDMPSFGGNPLEQVLRESVDFQAVAEGPVKVFVTATNVSTGRGRIFRKGDITPAALLASACLPQLFQAVEIDGEPYWDGGFAGNPTLVPLVLELTSDDTILVPINPIHRPGTPRSARDILDRVNEISFNAVALKELKMMALLRQVADAGGTECAAWARMRMHMVSNAVMVGLGYSSKLNAEWAFLGMLRDEGRKAAQAFLDEHGDAIGKRSSVDLDRLLEGI
jgi:NTE family protein